MLPTRTWSSRRIGRPTTTSSTPSRAVHSQTLGTETKTITPGTPRWVIVASTRGRSSSRHRLERSSCAEAVVDCATGHISMRTRKSLAPTVPDVTRFKRRHRRIVAMRDPPAAQIAQDRFKPFACQTTYGLRENSDRLQEVDQQGGAQDRHHPAHDGAAGGQSHYAGQPEPQARADDAND